MYSKGTSRILERGPGAGIEIYLNSRLAEHQGGRDISRRPRDRNRNERNEEEGGCYDRRRHAGGNNAVFGIQTLDFGQHRNSYSFEQRSARLLVPLPRTAVVVIYNDHSAPPLLANYNIYAKAKHDIDVSKNCP